VAHYLRTEGICLRRLAYSNTSQVASFLTPDSGRLSFMAKGVTRAPSKGVRTGFDLLGRYEILYTPRRPSSLQNLTYRWLREDFHGIRRSLRGILCGYYAIELALNFTMEGDPCPRLYRVMLEALRRFSGGQFLGMNVLVLELAVLQEHGTCPAFDRCAECGHALPERGPVTFSPADGGPLCPRCDESERGHTIPVRADFLRELHRLASGAEPLPLPPQRVVALSTVVRFHMRWLLDKELRMWKYLQRRQLSKSLRRVRRHAR